MTILPGADGVDRVLDAGERPGLALARALGDLIWHLHRAVTGFTMTLDSVSARQFRGAHDVLADHVALEVDAIADAAPASGSCAPA